MLKQTQQLKQQQKLSPLQIQTIKLLELTTLELEQKIESEIEENPALDEDEKEKNDDDEQKDEASDNNNDDDDFSIKDYMDDDEDDGIPSYKLQTHNYSKDDDKKEGFVLSSGESLQQHLIDQLGFRSLSERQYNIGVFLIGSIDDDGYLRRDLDYICDDMAFKQNIEVTKDELIAMLKIIQSFEPAGIGCRDLRECLLLQLQGKEMTPEVRNAQRVITYCFDEFTKKHYQKIMEKLSLSEVDLKDAISEIVKLNPKPGSGFSDDYSDQGKTIIPDFVLNANNDNVTISLNSYNVPDLRISENYMQMMHSYAAKNDKISTREKETAKFIKQKIESAKCFIEAIRQRQGTLLNVMNTIAEMQRPYLLSGDESQLRPMILKDVAERASLDVSTISRVLNGKYIQTNFGIIPLRHFFSESLQTDTGEDVSSREVKMILQQCIENENKNQPLTDVELANELKKKGYVIARRTIAKYREQLNLPVARLRKEI